MIPAYYKRFRIFTHSVIWKIYISNSLTNSLYDLDALGRSSIFEKPGFTAMQCGTSGFKTSKCFFDFLLKRNSDCRIIVLDKSNYPLNEIKRNVHRKYSGIKFSFIQCDALSIPIADASVDYIETDSFFQFFSLTALNQMLSEWHRVLKPDGFITTRCFCRNNQFGKIFDFFRKQLGKYLNVQFIIHDYPSIIASLNLAGFNFKSNCYALPTLRRFTLIKQSTKESNRYALVFNTDNYFLPSVISRIKALNFQNNFFIFETNLKKDKRYIVAHLKIFTTSFTFKLLFEGERGCKYF